MDSKYAATYQLEKVIVHVVAPPAVSPDEVERRLRSYQHAFLKWWNKLPDEECQRLNEKWEAEGR